MAWTWTAWGAMAGFVGVYGWIWDRTGTRGRKWLEWGLAALVAGVSAVSVAMHEPWRDELHAWLLARDWSALELFGQMRYEGHLAVWHLLLHPFARLGAGVAWSGLISWGINAVTLAWFARKAPLGGWAKAAAALSCVFLYVNPAISRCYVLVPPVLFGLAALWDKKDERPVAFGALVALLANTHVCMEGTAGLVFLVFARENVMRRRDGKAWRECGRQCTGLALMGAGIAAAMAQLVPGLWDRGLCFATGAGWKMGTRPFLQGCSGWVGIAGMATGLAWLGVEAWRRDKGAFWVYAGSLVYMVAFSVFLYPAHVVNRALMWWPVALGTAWILGRQEDGADRRGRWLTAAVVLVGLGLMRPDMTWSDWKGEYDTLPGACRFIAERYGKDAEVWVNGGDMCTEVASAYLGNVRDWRTGGRTERFSMAAKVQKPGRGFCDFLVGHFSAHPETENVLVLGSLVGGEQGLSIPDLVEPGVDVEYLSRRAICPWSGGVVVAKVSRDGFKEGAGRERNRNRMMEALERLARLDEEQWEVMNNLAWLLAEDGRVVEARAWMDRAMANEDARNNAGVWDTEAAVRRAEGNEEGAREAERRRDGLRASAQLKTKNEK